MRMRILVALSTAVVALLSAAPASAGGGHSPTIHIDFMCDRVGWKPNGWSAREVRKVEFRDSHGDDLYVENIGEDESRVKGLAVREDDESYLIIDIDQPADCIKLWFGNDDPLLSNPGDRAVLSVYSGGVQVGSASKVLNRNSEMDQEISVCGVSFDQARFLYDVTTPGLAELVDQITIRLP